MITPVGAALNLITIGFLDSLADTTIGFLTWMAITTPISLVTSALLLALVRLRLRSPPHCRATAPEPTLAAALGPWLPGQRNAVIAFATTVVL